MSDSNLFEQKPCSRGELFHSHKQMKSRTKEILLKHATTKNQTERWENHNFKKNTGYKPVFSCHGYGGKCGMCKSGAQVDEKNRAHKAQENRRAISSDMKEFSSTQSL